MSLIDSQMSNSQVSTDTQSSPQVMPEQATSTGQTHEGQEELTARRKNKWPGLN